ncbi:hypothetical protein SEA_PHRAPPUCCINO_83 [Mycobacterium phage Phrappuccino]|uniref:Minor tail protein n=1 Tax=Mycobacterium phage Phrappuccino TaxID=2591223 RepID=A0A514DDS8_9CAUD|nr:minor tail protein [Mycobacterium phage Phrappuccino]QDH91758.1 hypothetical protein SEA_PHRAPPUCCINO_83 [Mycobacterium phage Phrappuccino]QIQ63200.1 hypothetical protein SEA_SETTECANDELA_83 [Mycobacterium phage Settecandela]
MVGTPVGFSSGDTQPVAIMSVDPVNRQAIGLTRRRSEVTIDLRYHVGGLQVTPAVGEQWFIAQESTFYYRLISKIPYNAEEMNTEAEEGQVQVGSTGPLELHGSRVNIRGGVLTLGGVEYRSREGVLQYNSGTTEDPHWLPVAALTGPDGEALTTDNVVEGTTHLYFTTGRAAAAAPVQSVAGRTGNVTVTKADVGLSNVENIAVTALLAAKADLDGDGRVPSSQLPASGNPVRVYDDLASFPPSGLIGVLYIAADTRSIYLWDGESSYELFYTPGDGPANTDSLPEGTSNLYHTAERAAAAARTPEVLTLASTAAPIYNVEGIDHLEIVDLDTNIATMTAGMSGTPAHRQKLMIWIHALSTRSIFWGTGFRNSGVAALPTTAVANKTICIGVVYDATAEVWVCMAADPVGY